MGKKLQGLTILFVADVSISEIIGGAERVLYEQSTRLSKKGHNVHILTRKIKNHFNNKEIIDGVKEWRYNNSAENSFVFLKNTLLQGKRVFESLSKKYKFDCINFHQPFSSLAVIASPESRRLTKIYTCHSLSHEEFLSRNDIGKSLLSKIYAVINSQILKFIEKKVLNQSKKIIALS